MATVNRYNRIVCSRLCTAGFLHIEATKSALWLEQYNTGLTSREVKQIEDVRQMLHEAAEILRQMGGKIRADLKQ
jgi:hypothetical protein